MEQNIQDLMPFLQALIGTHPMQQQSSGSASGLASLLQNSYGSPVNQQQPQQQQQQQAGNQLGVDDLLNHSGGVDLGKIIESILQGRQSGQPSNTGISGGGDGLQGLRAMLGYNS